MWPARVIIIATHVDEAECLKNARGEWELEGKVELVNGLLKAFGSDLLIVPHLYIMDANEAASIEMKHLRTMLQEMKNFIVQVKNLCNSSRVFLLNRYSKNLCRVKEISSDIWFID